MHDWSDEWFKENGTVLYKAISLFTVLNQRLRGPFFFTKEKYGTMRLEAFYGTTSLDVWLFRVNPVFIHYPRLHRICSVLDCILRKLRITRLIWAYQVFVFNIATLITVRQYPQVKAEIMDEPEFEDLLYPWVKKSTGYVCGWTPYKEDVDKT